MPKIRLDGFGSNVQFVDPSEMAAIGFETSESQGHIIGIVLKSGYWFNVPSTPHNQNAMKPFISLDA